MPITREALARLERILDAMEEAHDAAIIEQTLAMTEAEIDSDLRARGIDPNELVKRLRQKLGLETGEVRSSLKDTNSHEPRARWRTKG